ncbi:alpha/beta hydrolase fold domain-containing protein [Halobium palmae]|uniref:Alpha/beta hydrolase fold domain-containing protein n=1 Tax=Halobium palmae TaxID=1776492 RepID=A0ABD5S020_9EURY
MTDENEPEAHEPTVSRRTMLAGTGTLGSVGLLGVFGRGDGDSAPADGNETASSGNGTRSEETHDAPEHFDVSVHRGLTYASRPSGDLKLDLYVPESDAPSPLVVWIHGGGWLVNTRKSHPNFVDHFVDEGFAMATVDHRLSEIPEGVDPVISPSPNNPVPRGVFPDHIVDVKASIRWLRAHGDEFGLDTSAVATWGSSSGAHLAALAGTLDSIEDVAGDVYPESAVEPTVYPDESGTVQAVVDWYGPTALLKMDPQLAGKGFPHDAPNSPESLLIGGQITENEAKVRRASPITYVDDDTPPFLLMHGTADTTVPFEQSQILFEALAEACGDATLYELHGVGHGFGFEAFTPALDQTVLGATCTVPGEGKDSELSLGGPPASSEVVGEFLAETLQ